MEKEKKPEKEEEPEVGLNIFSYSDGPCSVRAEHDFGGVDGDVETIFHRIAERLIELIEEQREGSFISCAMAWFTHYDILDALVAARKRGVRIAVLLSKDNFKKDTRAATKSARRGRYNSLGSMTSRQVACMCGYYAKDALENYDPAGECWDSEEGTEGMIHAVRCISTVRDRESYTFHRMHHKFFVFGRVQLGHPCVLYGDEEEVSLETMDELAAQIGKGGFDAFFLYPEMVVTGSFNGTTNADGCFENVVLIRRPETARRFHQHFSQMFMLSESLDYCEIERMNPTMRYTTTE